MKNIADDPWYTSSRAVPVARTCIDCGRFLSAQCFWGNGNRGRRPECGECSGRRNERPSATAFQVPLTGILLAKTCVDCGRFLDAQRFWGCGKRGRAHACGRCMKGRRYRYTTTVAA